jgi:hypothetical protein
VSKKKDKAAEAPEEVSAGVALATHPRARTSIRRVRAQAALGVFALVLFLSLRAGVPGPDALLRSLMFGIGAYFAAWFCAVAVWRQLVLGQLRVAEDAHRARRDARIEEARRIHDARAHAEANAKMQAAAEANAAAQA